MPFRANYHHTVIEVRPFSFGDTGTDIGIVGLGSLDPFPGSWTVRYRFRKGKGFCPGVKDITGVAEFRENHQLDLLLAGLGNQAERLLHVSVFVSDMGLHLKGSDLNEAFLPFVSFPRVGRYWYVLKTTWHLLLLYK
jgi:hypothetical protein